MFVLTKKSKEELRKIADSIQASEGQNWVYNGLLDKLNFHVEGLITSAYRQGYAVGKGKEPLGDPLWHPGEKYIVACKIPLSSASLPAKKAKARTFRYQLERMKKWLK